MSLHSELRRVVLAPREVFVLDTPDPVEISARRGCVWLTQAGDSRDIVLQAGQAFTMSRPTEVVVTSRGTAELVVTRAKPYVPRGFWRERLRLAAALVGRAFARAARPGAGRRLASRLHLGPPAEARMD